MKKETNRTNNKGGGGDIFPYAVATEPDVPLKPQDDLGVVANLAAKFLTPAFHKAANGDWPSAADRRRAIERAVSCAREVLAEVEKSEEVAAKAYQLFEPDDVMSDTKVAEIFKKAGWGKGRMNSAATVKSCVRSILAEARQEAGYWVQRSRFLKSGLDPEYIRFVASRYLGEVFQKVGYNAIFDESSSSEIERILYQLHDRAASRLIERSPASSDVPMVDETFCARVFLSPRSDLDDKCGGEMGVRKMVSVAQALRKSGLDEKRESSKTVDSLQSLHGWFVSFSDFPPKVIKSLSDSIEIIRTGDSNAVEEVFRAVFKILDQEVGGELAFDFLRKLDWGSVYVLLGSDTESLEDNILPSIVQDPGKDEKFRYEALSFNRGLRKLACWRDNGELPSFPGMISPVFSSKSEVLGELANSYRTHLSIAVGFLDEMDILAGRCLRDDTGELLKDGFAALGDQVRRESALLNYFGSQVDVVDLENWGTKQLQEILAPSSSSFRPYPIFLYADLRGLERGRLEPLDLGKVDRSMLVSDAHDMDDPIPYGVADYSSASGN